MRLLHQRRAGTVRIGLDVVHGGRQDDLRPLAERNARQPRQRAPSRIEVRRAGKVRIEPIKVLLRLVVRIRAGQVRVTLGLDGFFASSSVGNLRPYGLGCLELIALVSDVCH